MGYGRNPINWWQNIGRFQESPFAQFPGQTQRQVGMPQPMPELGRTWRNVGGDGTAQPRLMPMPRPQPPTGGLYGRLRGLPGVAVQPASWKSANYVPMFGAGVSRRVGMPTPEPQPTQRKVGPMPQPHPVDTSRYRLF